MKFSDEVLKSKGIHPPSRKGSKASEETRKKMSNSHKGKHLKENNCCWKGGISARYYQRIAFENLPNICEICGSVDNLEVHHKDRNRQNNDINNLTIICSICHHKIHRRWKNA